MDPILDIGIRLILSLQGIGGWLIAPMKVFSFLGNEEFYLFIAPAIYWCISATLGLRLGIILMLSGVINFGFKVALRGPRPYWYSPEVQAFTAESSFGIPSGHSQNAAAIWGLLAAWTGKLWGWIAAIALIFLIGLSRMALGVHFPTDVLTGWLIGAVLLWLFFRLEGPVIEWLKKRPAADQVLSVFGASLGLILFGTLIRISLGAWSVPSGWASMAAQALPEADPIDPLSLSGLVSNAGTFFGLAAGAIVMHMGGGFDATGPWWQRAARYLVGLVGVFVLWYGLGLVFPRGEYLLSYGLRFLRYGLIGFWISALAPLLFIRMKLAQPVQPGAQLAQPVASKQTAP